MKFIKNHLSNKLILVSLILLQIIVIGKTNKTNNKVSDEKFTEIIKDVKENFKKLKSIVTEKGGKVEGLKLGFINKNNRFLKTKNDVKKGDNLASIPASLILFDDNEELTETCNKIKKVLPKLNRQEAFNFCAAMYLFELRSDPSHELSSYFKLLPKYGFKNFPIFYSKKKIDMLNNTLFLGSLAKDKKILKESYEKLKKELGDEISFQEEDFLRNYYTINSRNVFFDNIDKKALVPIGDLINFNPFNINSVLIYNKDKNVVEINATQDIPAGEEITLDYGFKSNKDYLINYGFTIEKPADLKVDIELNNNEKVSLSRANYDIYNNSVKLAKKSKDPLKNLIKLAKILGGTILSYNSSLEHDVKKLRKIDDLSKREIDILRVLEEEKEIFYEGFDVVNSILHFLKNSKKDAKLKELDYITQDIFTIAEQNEEKIRKELKTHKIKVLPVSDYDIYKRPDFIEFLKSLNK